MSTSLKTPPESRSTDRGDEWSRNDATEQKDWPISRERRRGDRILIAVMMVGLVAVMALVIWLAIVSPPPENIPYPILP